jgi:hypothetical protein
VLATRAGQAGVSTPGWIARGVKLGSLPARQLAVVLSLYASLLHNWVLPEHYREWWGYGLFFFVCTAAQAFYAGAILFWPRRPVYVLGILGTAAVLVLYAVTRTLGVPLVGPYSGHVEPVGFTDLLAAAVEVALIAVLVCLVARPSASPPRPKGPVACTPASLDARS